MSIRLVYFGTSQFAVPALQKLAERRDLFDVVAVVTQSQKPTGRHRTLADSPVAATAKQLDIPVLRPQKIRTEEFSSQIKQLAPDILVVAAYGKILPITVLEIPRLGAVNLHGSLLPRYRGASPIQSAILHGETATGVTLMCMDEQLDHGKIIARVTVPVAFDDTASSLEKKLAFAAADLTIAELPRYIAHPSIAYAQDHTQATFTRIINREDGLVDFTTSSANEIERKIRAFTPWPGVYIIWNRQKAPAIRIKILRVQIVDMAPQAVAGTITRSAQKNPIVKCAQGSLELLELQPEGKKSMSGSAFLNGYGDFF